MDREFGLVYSAVQTTWKNRTKTTGEFEQNCSRMKRFSRPERSDVDGTLAEVVLATGKLQRTRKWPSSHDNLCSP